MCGEISIAAVSYTHLGMRKPELKDALIARLKTGQMKEAGDMPASAGEEEARRIGGSEQIESVESVESKGDSNIGTAACHESIQTDPEVFQAENISSGSPVSPEADAGKAADRTENFKADEGVSNYNSHREYRQPKNYRSRQEHGDTRSYSRDRRTVQAPDAKDSFGGRSQMISHEGTNSREHSHFHEPLGNREHSQETQESNEARDFHGREMKNETREKGEKRQYSNEERPQVKGILDIAEGGFGFLRFHNFLTSDRDIYVSPTQIRRFNLKTGDKIKGISRRPNEGERFGALLYVNTVNGDEPGVSMRRPNFEDLTQMCIRDSLKSGRRFYQDVPRLPILM